MRKALFFLGTLALLSACTDADPHRECKQHADCAEGEVCQFDVCVDEGSVQDNVCKTGFAYCGGECVDTLSTLATCGGCDGCPAVEHAGAVSCSQGTCQYTCTDNYRDRDDNAANGCDCPPGTDCNCIVEGPELCDLRDNDCDGVVDNVQLTDPAAEWRAHCRELPHAQPDACQSGFCTYVCDEGYADRNNPADGCECEITPEVCDGADNDCNGIIDDGAQSDLCQPVAGANPICLGTECIYNCADDKVDVDNDLALGTGGNGCECEIMGAEVCDGIDNDCDGLTDSEDDSLTTALCENQAGVCEGSHRACVDGLEAPCALDQFAAHAATQGTRFEPLESSCDFIDNNCDGDIDEPCCPGDGEFEHEIRLMGAPEGDDYWRGMSQAATDDGHVVMVVATSGSRVLMTRIDVVAARVAQPVVLAEVGADRLAVRWAHEFFWVARINDEVAEIDRIATDGTVIATVTVQMPAAPREWFVDLCLREANEDLALVYTTGEQLVALRFNVAGAIVATDTAPASASYLVDCVEADAGLVILVESESQADSIRLIEVHEASINFGAQRALDNTPEPLRLPFLNPHDRQEWVPHSGLARTGETLTVVQRFGRNPGDSTTVTLFDATLGVLDDYRARSTDSAHGVTALHERPGDILVVGVFDMYSLTPRGWAEGRIPSILGNTAHTRTLASLPNGALAVGVALGGYPGSEMQTREEVVGVVINRDSERICPFAE
jgi:hypothetical protein